MKNVNRFFIDGKVFFVNFKWADFFLLTSIILNLITSAKGAFAYRFLMHDGGSFTFMAVAKNERFYDRSFLRIFHSLLQLPALFFYNHFGEPQDLDIFLNVAALTYWLFPILGLVFSYLLLLECHRRDFFIFVLLSFALATQSTLSNVGGLVLDNLVFFWPALIMVFINRCFSVRHFVFMLGIIFSWSISHESSILCLGFIGGLTLIRSPMTTGWERIRLTLTGLFCLAVGIWISWRVLGPGHLDTQWFQQDFKTNWGPFRVGCLYLTLLLLFYFVSAVFSKREFAKGLLICAFAGVVFFTGKLLLFTDGSIFYWDSVRARTSAIPFCLFIASIAVSGELWSFGWICRSRMRQTSLLWFTALALSFAGFNDLMRDVHWQNSAEQIRYLTFESPGCAELDNHNSTWTRLEREGVNKSLVPLLGILLSNSLSVSKIIFDRDLDKKEYEAYCCNMASGRLTFYEAQRGIEDLRFNFWPLLQNIRNQRFTCP